MTASPGGSTDTTTLLQDYAARRRALEGACASIKHAVEARLQDDGLNYHQITRRVKDIESLQQKLARRNPDGSRKYADGLRGIDDLIGIRVIMFLETDVLKAVEALKGVFVVKEHVDKTAQGREMGILGYAGQHLVLEVGQENPPSGCSSCKGQRFEVQIRTVLQHAWAEFEHEVRYKSTLPIPASVDRALSMASGLLELADQQFVTISETVRGEMTEGGELHTREPEEVLTAEGVAELLIARMPEYPSSRQEQYGWLADALAVCGIRTEIQLEEFLEDVDRAAVTGRMGYRFPPGHVRVMDDLLLSAFAEDYVERTAHLGDDEQRATKLRHRLGKLRGG